MSEVERQYNLIINECKKHGFSPTQAEIVAQLHALNPFFRQLYHIETITNIKDKGEDGYTREGVRLCSRGKAKINIDIIYYPVPDAYRIKAYKLTNHGLDIETIYDQKDIFFIELDETIHQILHKHAGIPLRYI